MDPLELCLQLAFFTSNKYHDEIDDLISRGIFIIHNSGLLYTVVEPTINLYPDVCVYFSSGNSNIYEIYACLKDLNNLNNTKNDFLNCRVFIFQYLGKYKSNNNRICSLKEKYDDTINLSLQVLNELHFNKIVYIGHSFGTFSVIDRGVGIVGIIFPFDINIESRLFMDAFNCRKRLSEIQDKQFFVIAGTRDEISLKTTIELCDFDNFHVEWLDIEHSLLKNRKMLIPSFFEFIIRCNFD